ncbi:fungal-specific transcription factor domain-containing protein [Xylaria bambusicola]|uniref:fungal-specific transcription factor domain-containing protein n=1 Tax=Xylaria bambusicola TaxID=326684 RepID=UPI002007E69C|nr:fungal-specific transcription factor domain-containing protein [Xylaria bambusicola]KAI0523686.1 fungal-specific transcription factor domain-containing protein [Xylaria bambusicola]
MTSVLVVQPRDIKASLSVTQPFSIMTQTRRPTPPLQAKAEEDPECLPNQAEDYEIDDVDSDGDGDIKNENSSNSEGPVKKRRRSRKGLDKKFECPTEGCGKSYSRAEHLHRHQLNHTPKQIYRCNFPDCNREFVRLDLCNRHRDRHTAKGSALSRKDSLISQSSPVDNVRSPYPTPASTTMSPKHTKLGNVALRTEHAAHSQYQSPKDGVGIGTPYTPMASTSPATFPHPGPSNLSDAYMHSDQVSTYNPRLAHQSPTGQQQRLHSHSGGSAYGVLSPVSTHSGSYHLQPIHTPQSAPTMPFVAPNNFPAFSLPPSDFNAANGVGAGSTSTPQYAPAASTDYGEHSHPQTSTDMMLLDQMTAQATMPVFGPDGMINKSPYVSIPEDFVAYLFNTTSPNRSPSTVGHIVTRNPYSSYGDYQQQYSVQYSGCDGVPLGYFPPGQVMAVTNLLDSNLPESILSDEKSQEIFDLIKERFDENSHAPVDRQGENLLEGDRSDDEHMLSRKMMQIYIGSYWLHFSDQVPILHKPTFSPDRTENLLLIAVMAIGAACLDRSHGVKALQAGANLSNFLAWNLRWEMFKDTSCRPPAKLWAFQTMILLELYEKMYSTRELHERAHIFHATTITLMRRGRSLIGKSALDSPPSARDDRSTSAGSRQSSTSGPAHTPDEWWNTWITNESTRRAAFTAFLIDSIHATMFGHSTVMVAHEMRLPLPCDDQLWKATTGAEVGRIESNHMSNGIKPMPFLEGLKRTLAGQEVHTNPFGRQILMAGLLSVSWHMNQRDLQVSSLGPNMSQALGGRDKWRGTLMRAFDSWRNEFDKALQHSNLAFDPYSSDRRNDANVVFESRTVLHHLAHMAMHVDIVDCQIFARAKRLIGRAIGSQDLSSAQRRMKDHWAPSARARDATFYAIKFLCSVLLDGTQYCARDDVLLNRPWVLYFAALVVWCYGFAIAGPCPGYVVPSNREEKHAQMRDYLQRLGSIQTPDDLKVMKDVNKSSALLAVLKDTFGLTRWELLHEGATLLDNCIQLNSGSMI